MKEIEGNKTARLVKVPKILANYPKDQIGLAIHLFANEIYKLNQLKEKIDEDKYQQSCQIRITLEKPFEELLQFLCKKENLTVKEVITLALLAREEKMLSDKL